MIHYKPSLDEKEILKDTIRKIKKAFFNLGCLVPPSVTHIRPMGASVHYSGTIPMSKKNESLTVSDYCQSHDFTNLFIVDGTTFPFLPAKQLTFTLMANAVRVAATAF
jgi:choline dehydrogenase-like flavoprotein